MAHRKFGRIPFSLSGTGNAVAEMGLPSGYARRNLRVLRFCVRQAAGGGGTAADFYFIDHNRSGTSVTSSPSTVPKEDVPIEILAVPLTASASALSLDTPVEANFEDTLNLVASVTAVGAWTLSGYIDFEV